MRTTIELPDELFRQVEARAALSGLSLKELITYWVERGLQSGDEPTPARSRQKRPLPVIVEPRGREMPAFSSSEIEELLDPEEAEIADADG